MTGSKGEPQRGDAWVLTEPRKVILLRRVLRVITCLTQEFLVILVSMISKSTDQRLHPDKLPERTPAQEVRNYKLSNFQKDHLHLFYLELLRLPRARKG